MVQCRSAGRLQIQTVWLSIHTHSVPSCYVPRCPLVLRSLTTRYSLHSHQTYTSITAHTDRYVNKKKTKHMLIGKKNKDTPESDLHICESEIDIVENFVYLGTNIDNKLSFEKFVNSTVS